MMGEGQVIRKWACLPWIVYAVFTMEIKSFIKSSTCFLICVWYIEIHLSKKDHTIEYTINFKNVAVHF